MSQLKGSLTQQTQESTDQTLAWHAFYPYDLATFVVSQYIQTSVYIHYIQYYSHPHSPSAGIHHLFVPSQLWLAVPWWWLPARVHISFTYGLAQRRIRPSFTPQYGVGRCGISFIHSVIMISMMLIDTIDLVCLRTIECLYDCINASTNECINASTNECINASTNECINTSTNDCINASTNESINASTNECINTSTNECINASTNE